jgi:hypothetical protein
MALLREPADLLLTGFVRLPSRLYLKWVIAVGMSAAGPLSQ